MWASKLLQMHQCNRHPGKGRSGKGGNQHLSRCIWAPGPSRKICKQRWASKLVEMHLCTRSSGRRKQWQRQTSKPVQMHLGTRPSRNSQSWALKFVEMYLSISLGQKVGIETFPDASVQQPSRRRKQVGKEVIDTCLIASGCEPTKKKELGKGGHQNVFRCIREPGKGRSGKSRHQCLSSVQMHLGTRPSRKQKGKSGHRNLSRCICVSAIQKKEVDKGEHQHVQMNLVPAHLERRINPGKHQPSKVEMATKTCPFESLGSNPFRGRKKANVGIKTCSNASQTCHTEIEMMQRWTSKLVLMPLEVGKER